MVISSAPRSRLNVHVRLRLETLIFQIFEVACAGSQEELRQIETAGRQRGFVSLRMLF
jgi:hypothetical protein